jgi:hypothetical protein
MEDHFNQLIVSFNDHASKIYADLFDQFCKAAGSLNRKRDDNVFNMQVAKYSQELKNRLDELAKKKLENIPQLHDKLLVALSGAIQFYLHEFSLRCNALR